MVLLSVKGTKHADEFTFECSCKDLAKDIAPKVVAIQNKRLSVRNQLSSWNELIPSARVAAGMEGRAPEDKALAEGVEALLAEINAEMKNARKSVLPETHANYWERLRDYAVKIFPNECANKDDPEGTYDAAIVALYNLYDNPEIDEDYRLMVYHCRCIMDPLWRVHDMLDEKKSVSLWFNGKEILPDSTIGTLCANNEKSRIIVKVALSGGAAPSLEPRIDYAQQRELRQLFTAKAEERKTLEESETHAIIKKQHQGNPAAAIGFIANARVASHNAPASSLKGGKISETVIEGA